MNPHDQTLHLVSSLFAILMILMVIIPYVLRRTDLLTAWNFFLVGSALFIGVSGVASAQTKHFEAYTRDVYTKYYIGLFVFYAVCFAVYWGLKLPRRLAGCLFLKWPPFTTNSMITLAIFAMLLSLLAVIPLQIPFLGQLAFQVFVRGGPFALVFALVAFKLERDNPVTIIILCVVFIFSIVLSMASGGGRRFFLSILLAIPIYWYWISLRYKRLAKSIIIIVGGSIITLVLIEAFDKVRHRHSGDTGVTRAIESVKLLSEKIGVFNDLLRIAQNSVECSLLTIHFFSSQNKIEQPFPFHALYVVAVNPIPRQFWVNKPISLGLMLPEMALKFGAKGYRRVNWGVSPWGQGYHDGGLVPIVVYAVLWAFSLRFFDELLLREPDNPFLIGWLAASSGQIIGWPRGGIDTNWIQIIGCTLAFLLLLCVGKLFLGVGRIYPRTDHISRFPNVKKLREWGWR